MATEVKKYTEQDKRQVVEKWLELRKNMNAAEAAEQAGADVHWSTVYNWARKYGYSLEGEDQPVSKPKAAKEKSKRKPKLVQIPVHEPAHEQAPAPKGWSGEKRQMIVMMGDVDQIMQVLPKVFNKESA